MTLYDSTNIEERVYVWTTIPAGVEAHDDYMAIAEHICKRLGYRLETRSLGHGEVEVFAVRPSVPRDD